jgi:hypothetical protein
LNLNNQTRNDSFCPYKFDRFSLVRVKPKSAFVGEPFVLVWRTAQAAMQIEFIEFGAEVEGENSFISLILCLLFAIIVLRAGAESFAKFGLSFSKLIVRFSDCALSPRQCHNF